jgi:hypothetical protein
VDGVHTLGLGADDALTTTREVIADCVRIAPQAPSDRDELATVRGIGTTWTTCHLSYEKDMAALLGIPYDQVVQAALTPVAYTVGTSFRPAQRADPRGFVHWNTW